MSNWHPKGEIPSCPAPPASADESASSTTGTSQESGQTRLSGEARKALERFLAMVEETPPTDQHQSNILLLNAYMDEMVTKPLKALLQEQATTNSLLLALIEALGEDPDPEELHIPKPL